MLMPFTASHDTGGSMVVNTRTVMQTAGGVCIVDLEDFPHGELFDIRLDAEYNIEFYTVPSGTQVRSYNPDSAATEWMGVTGWSVHRGKKLEIVTLTDGSQIYTDDDPRAIFGVACDSDSASPTRFTPSDAVRHKVLVPVSQEEFTDTAADSWYCLETGMITTHRGQCTAKIDFRLGQFVGVFAGAGWADSSQKLWMYDAHGFNFEFVSSFLREHYPAMKVMGTPLNSDAISGRCGHTVKYRFYTGTPGLSRSVNELVDGRRDEHTPGSANRRLPTWYQLAGKDFIRGLVCGLIATDGTVAVTRRKSNPQLEIKFTSASLRLCRELQRCCRILGVRCKVMSGKATSAGVASWVCLISAVDAKRVNLLSGCCHKDKLQRFMDTPVSDAPCRAKSDEVPFTKDISNELVRLIPSNKPRHRRLTPAEAEQYNVYLNARTAAKRGRIARFRARSVKALASRLAAEAEAAFTSAATVFSALFLEVLKAYESRGNSDVKDVYVAVSAEDVAAIRAGIAACRRHCRRDAVLEGLLSKTCRLGRKKQLSCLLATRIKNFFDTYLPNTDLRDSEALRKLMLLVESPIRWEGIESVEQTGVEHIGYDLTVPGYDTFMNADGVILSNTMNFHVPSSDKAVAEAADKMLPSKNLFSLTDLASPRYTPMMEVTLGLAKLTAPPSKKSPQVFVTRQEAIRAYRRGEIGANDPVSVLRG